MHGTLDPLTPVDGARHLVEPLRKMSTSPVVYAELPGGHHSFDLFHSVRFETVINGIEAFVEMVRSSRPSTISPGLNTPADSRPTSEI